MSSVTGKYQQYELGKALASMAEARRRLKLALEDMTEAQVASVGGMLGNALDGLDSAQGYTESAIREEH